MDVSRRAALRTLAAGAIGTVTGTAAHGYLYERHRIRLTETPVRVRRVPPALVGLRIAILTDLHYSPLVAREHIDEAADLAVRARPDLIVLLGDFITNGNPRFVRGCVDALRHLRAPHGVFAVLGNHDETPSLPRALAAADIEVLQDARTRIIVRGETVDIAGLKFWTRRAGDIANIVRGAGDALILLAHDPLRLREAAALDVPLLLSGHTHGGQIVLPVIGPVARRYPVASGVGSQGNTKLFVSRGVGTVVVPIRVNCPPEVAVVTLQSTWGGGSTGPSRREA